MTTPTIHIGGSPAKQLADEAFEALAKVQDAIMAMQRMTVNGRDFYPQGPAAINHAEAEQRSRISRLQGIEAELSAYIEAIVWPA